MNIDSGNVWQVRIQQIYSFSTVNDFFGEAGFMLRSGEIKELRQTIYLKIAFYPFSQLSCKLQGTNEFASSWYKADEHSKDLGTNPSDFSQKVLERKSSAQEPLGYAVIVFQR